MVRPFMFLLPVAGCLAMSAAMADEMRDGVRQCADIDDDVLRLECFDRSVRGDAEDKDLRTNGHTPGMRHAEVTGSIHEEPAAQPSDAPPTAENRFGLNRETEPDSSEDEPDQITARISEIEIRRYGHRVFTLDNGQTWVEESANRGFRLNVGDSVTVKSGLFGSYRLFGSGNKSSRVERVR